MGATAVAAALSVVAAVSPSAWAQEDATESNEEETDEQTPPPPSMLPPRVPDSARRAPTDIEQRNFNKDMIPVPRGAVTPSPRPVLTTPTEIQFRNDAAGAFRLVGAEIFLDGRRVHTASPTVGPRELSSFASEMAPGPHELTVRADLEGRSAAPSGHLQGRRVHVEGGGSFVLPENGKRAVFTVVTRERKGANVPIGYPLEITIEAVRAR